VARFRRFDVVLPSASLDNTIEALRQRRAGMGAAMVELEDAVARSGRPLEEWIETVRGALEQLRAVVDHHIFATEAPGGFLDEMIEESPRLANPAHRLREEHGEIVDALSAASARLRAGPSFDPDDWIDVMRDRLLALLGMLSRHRQRGADLVYEAYDVDIGGTG
jgi:hypothetical protein